MDISFEEYDKNRFGIEQAVYQNAVLAYESLPQSVNKHIL